MAREQNNYDRLRTMLNQGAELSYGEACRRLGLRSVRQVQRLLAQLRDDGVPISESRGTRRRGKIFFIPPEAREHGMYVYLNEAQHFALAVAAEAARATFAPTPLGPPLQEAFRHLLASLPTEVFWFDTEDMQAHWHFSEGPSVSLDPAIFLGLTHAVEECRRIKIDYFTASKNRWSYGRTIDPYGLAVRKGSWILVAYCREQRDMREFALAGIKRLEQTEEFFLRPDFRLDTYFGSRFNAVGGGPRYTILLRVEADRAPYFDRKMYHHSQEVKRRHDDGRIDVQYTVEGLKEFRSFAQSWGTGVTVLEPAELREILRREAEEIAERYSEQSKGS